MSGKLFGQIVLLMIILVIIMTVTKCAARRFCPMMKGMKSCPISMQK